MPFDAHKNLSIATVANSPGTAGLSLTVGGGEGARFPAVPFNATVWPATELPTPVNAEVVRVTARTADALTIVRTQEGTTARGIVAGDLIAATITAKSLTDIESGVNFPQLATTGDLLLQGGGPRSIGLGTSDGADTGYLGIYGGGGAGTTRGGYVYLGGNESPIPGAVQLAAGNVAGGVIEFYTAASALRGRMHPSGGFSWGGTTDPGAGNLSVTGLMGIGTVGGGIIRANTQPGADSAFLYLNGGGGSSVDASRGAFFGVGGNQSVAPGVIQLVAGNMPAGQIQFYTGASAMRGVMHPSGGFSWGGTTDPGASVFRVGPDAVTCTNVTPGSIETKTTTTGTAYHYAFFNPNGAVGTITTNGSSTTYATTSDARLKTPLGRHTDTGVLRQTVIHNFVWNADGTVGRGVFAQEAHRIAPFAVSVGSDEVDAEGRLTKPWGVDYSKYVPDLITGWQHHDTRIGALFGDQLLAAERLTALEKRLSIPQPSLMNRLESLGRLVTQSVFTAWNAWKPSWI